jgi:hypothetical protein
VTERIYEGLRAESVGGAKVTVREAYANGLQTCRPLNPRYDLRRHSPGGFQWSYSGSGPAQLALALLADATGDDALAQRHYQEFKSTFLAALYTDHWTLARGEILAWVTEAEERRNSEEGSDTDGMRFREERP